MLKALLMVGSFCFYWLCAPVSFLTGSISGLLRADSISDCFILRFSLFLRIFESLGFLLMKRGPVSFSLLSYGGTAFLNLLSL